MNAAKATYIITLLITLNKYWDFFYKWEQNGILIQNGRQVITTTTITTKIILKLCRSLRDFSETFQMSTPVIQQTRKVFYGGSWKCWTKIRGMERKTAPALIIDKERWIGKEKACQKSFIPYQNGHSVFSRPNWCRASQDPASVQYVVFHQTAVCETREG